MVSAIASQLDDLIANLAGLFFLVNVLPVNGWVFPWALWLPLTVQNPVFLD